MVRRKLLMVALGAALLTVLGSASVAQAQYYGRRGYYAPATRGVYRSGVVFGFGLGFGGISASDCGILCGISGFGEAHIGGMIAPNVAVMGDFWEGLHFFSGNANVGSGQTYNGIYTLALQWWPAYNIWLKGGLGFGRIQIAEDYAYYALDDETGFAFMLAGGIELFQNYNFALDLQLRYGNVAYGGNANSIGDVSMYGVMLGFNWY